MVVKNIRFPLIGCRKPTTDFVNWEVLISHWQRWKLLYIRSTVLEGDCLIMAENEVMKTIMYRHFIRRFEEKQIAENELEQILHAGMYAPSASGHQGVIFAVCQNKKVNEKLGKIKRANSNLHMATATSYVSKEQISIADNSNIINAFYDAPTVITMFAPKNFLFR